MKNIPGAISRLFRTKPVGIALSLIAGRSWSRMSSSVMAFQLKAPGLRLGPGCRVIRRAPHLIWQQHLRRTQSLARSRDFVSGAAIPAENSDRRLGLFF